MTHQEYKPGMEDRPGNEYGPRAEYGSKTEYDIAIAGGGPAGSTAALLLAREGLRVVIIERNGYEEPRIGETLSPAVNPLLKEMGVWPSFKAIGALPSFGNQSAWGGEDLLDSSFIFSMHGNGWHLNRQAFDKMLFKEACAAGAEAILQAKPASCEYDKNAWQIILKEKNGRSRTIRARGLIEASGRKAPVARLLGASILATDRLMAIYTLYNGHKKPHCYTLTETVPHGWWYSAPVPGNKLVVTFFTDASHCRLLRSGEQEHWKKLVKDSRYTSVRVAGGLPGHQTKIVTAGSHRLARNGWQGPWLACGDAALSVDPLSSSGIQRALETGRDAAHAMHAWLKGDSTRARVYEESLDHSFRNYLVTRGQYYALEKRWPQSGFWREQCQLGMEGRPD